jgi:hypothetical protein
LLETARLLDFPAPRVETLDRLDPVVLERAEEKHGLPRVAGPDLFVALDVTART